MARSVSHPVGAFEHVAVRPGAHRGEDRLVVLEHREHQYGGIRGRLEDTSRRLDTGHPRHVEVHQDHIGPQLQRSSDGLFAVGRLSDQLGVGLGAQYGAHPATEDRVIVGDEDADTFG